MQRTTSHAQSLFATLAVLGLVAAAAPAAAQCVSSQFTKSHTWDDLDLDAKPGPGDRFHYTLVFCDGAGNRRCKFEDVLPVELQLDSASVVCTPDPGTNLPDLCAEDPPGSGVVVVDYSVGRMTNGACVTVTFDATVLSEPIAPVCNQAVNVNATTDTSNQDCETAGLVGDLSLVKSALAAIVPIGGQSQFRITVRNIGRAPLAGVELRDFHQACFDVLGPDLAACDPALVACAGPACATATCVYANGGFGFTYSGLDLAGAGAPPGGDDTVTVDVTLTAGSITGLCANDIETSDPDSPLLTARAEVMIQEACDLLAGDVTFPPIAPAYPTLYASPCAGGDPRLTTIHTVAFVPGDLADDAVAPAGTLRLYQIACPCTDRLGLVKSALGKVSIAIF